MEGGLMVLHLASNGVSSVIFSSSSCCYGKDWQNI